MGEAGAHALVREGQTGPGDDSVLVSASIFGCAGTTLSTEERAFFRDARPWGFILFTRNCENPDQVRRLTASLRESVARDAPIFIDQEGGRVARLKPPHWRVSPPAAQFGALFRDTEEGAREATYLNARLIASELIDLGINADCMPCLDVPMAGAHDIIGDRAFDRDARTVIELGRAFAEGLLDGGVLPVAKHIPGHGRAGADSHEALPVVDAPHEELSRTDFVTFRGLNTLPMAMTAHVVYSALDAQRCATLSPRIIHTVIRGEIGFQGLLMSDDLGMKALAGSFSERARLALNAGCDVVLHCNGNLDEMKSVMEGTRKLAAEAAERADAALACLRKAAPVDIDGMEKRIARIMSERQVESA